MNPKFYTLQEGEPDSSGGGGSLLNDPPAAPDTGEPSSDGEPSTIDATKPYYDGLFKTDGTINTTNYDRLPEELMPHKETFQKYGTAEALFTKFHNLETLAGKKGLQALPEGASEEDRAKHNALIGEITGVPDTPEGYGLVKPEDLPDEYWNEDNAKEFATAAKAENVTPKQLQALQTVQHQQNQKALAEQGQMEEAYHKEQKAILEAAWGTGEDFIKNEQLARRGARTLNVDIEKYHGDAELLQAFHAITGMVSESRQVFDVGEQGGTGQNAKQKAADIINNEVNPLNKAFWDVNHPQHEFATKEQQRLEAIARKQNIMD